MSGTVLGTEKPGGVGSPGVQLQHRTDMIPLRGWIDRQLAGGSVNSSGCSVPGESEAKLSSAATKVPF